MITPENYALSLTIGEFPYMSRGNLPNEKGGQIWETSPMEITREYQLGIINAGLKRLHTNKHALEKDLGIKEGAIKDLVRGKRPMEAGKWEKIKNYLLEYRVPILGEIGASDAIELIPEFDEVLKRSPQEIKSMGLETFLVPSEFGGRIVHAWRVKSSWEGPLLREGDMVWTTQIDYENFDKYLDSEILLKLIDGRTFIKTLAGEKNTNQYNLLGLGVHGLMSNVKILWCAQIIGHIKKLPLN